MYKKLQILLTKSARKTDIIRSVNLKYYACHVGHGRRTSTTDGSSLILSSNVIYVRYDPANAMEFLSYAVKSNL